MSVPEAIAWLENYAGARAGQAPQIYATAVLSELERLSRALDAAVRECEKLDRMHQEVLADHRKVVFTMDQLQDQARLARDEWDAVRIDLEQRVMTLKGQVDLAETMLKDTHYALTKQPDLTREDIANAITSVVRPYAEGEK